MKIALALALVLVAAGCSTAPTKPATLSVHQRYEIACVGGGLAFGVIADVNNVHTLTGQQQKQALDAKSKIDKRCKLAPGQDYPYTATEAVMSELEGAAAILKKIKGEVQ